MEKRTKATIAALSAVGVIIALTNTTVTKGITKAVYSVKYNTLATNLLSVDRGVLLRMDVQDSISKNKEFKKETYGEISEGDDLIKKLTPYLEEYGQYFSGSQVVDFKHILEKEYVIEDSSFNSGLELYDAMLETLHCGKEFGNGIKKAYVTSVIKEHFGYGSVLEEGKLYWIYEQITDILPRHTTAKYIIQNDINGLVEELTSAYELSSPDKIKELVTLIDECNQDNIDYGTQKVLIERIEKTYKEILKNKLKNKEFAQTLQGRVFQEYIDGHESYVNPNHTKEGVAYELHSEKYGSINFGSKNVKPTTTISRENILIQYANELLNKEYNSEEKFSTQIIELCSYIVDWDSLTRFNKENPIGDFWNSLSNYFGTEAELAEFLIALNNQNEIAVKEYLSIVTSKLTSEEPTIDTVAELESLDAYYNDNSYRHAYNWNREGYLSTLESSKVIKGSDEEQYFDIILEDFLFGEVDPEPYFKKVREHLASTNLLVNDLKSSVYDVRDYKKGMRTLKDPTEVMVYSKPVYPKQTTINNKQYVYFVVPSGYEESECVRVHQNIENQKFEDKVLGIQTTMYNYNTGNEDKVILVHLGKTTDLSTFEPVVFKTAYNKIIEYAENIGSKSQHTLRYFK